MQNSIAVDLKRNVKTNEKLRGGTKRCAESVFDRMMDTWKPLDDTDPTTYDQLHCLTNTYAFMNAFTPVLRGLLQEAENRKETVRTKDLRKLLADIESPVSVCVCALSYHDTFLLQTRIYRTPFSPHFWGLSTNAKRNGLSTNPKRNLTFGAPCWSRRVFEGLALQASKVPVGGSVGRPLTSV
jgi:hypothetical protein